jgi:hypothetical protein
VALAVFPTAAVAQASLPASEQVPLLLKVLTYDRQFGAKGGDKLVVGIVFLAEDAESLNAANEIIRTLRRFRGKTVKGLPIDYVTMPYVSQQRLEEQINESNVNVMYLAPGSDSFLPTVLRVSKAKRVTTTTGVPDYVHDGVAVGIGVRRGRPQILINLEGSKAEGSDFDASLLRIATVVP